jgi:ABC-2 type transport system permease protein
MRILDLAIKDLRQILRERQSAFFLLVLPVVFTLMFGFAFGGFNAGGDDDDPRLPVGFLNRDEGLAAEQLIVLLEQSDLLRLVDGPKLDMPEDEAEQAEQLKQGELAATVLVPADFSAAMLAGEPTPLNLTVDPASTTGFAVQGEIEATVSRLADAVETARISTETAVTQVGLTGADEQAYFEEAFVRAVAAWAEPPLRVETSVTGAIEIEETGDAAVYGDNAFSHTSPGMMAQFALAGLITAAQVLVIERKSGSLRRLLTTNMSRAGILAGHYLAMFIMIIAQLLLLVLFGQLLLQLPYFQQPAATMLLVFCSAFFAAGMGLLIGALAKSEEQAIVFSLVPMFIFSGLGGAWMPLEFTPVYVQRIALLTPVAWMMDGFKDILVRGQGLESVLLAAAVLVLYGVVFWVLAAWRFRFE